MESCYVEKETISIAKYVLPANDVSRFERKTLLQMDTIKWKMSWSAFIYDFIGDLSGMISFKLRKFHGVLQLFKVLDFP